MRHDSCMYAAHTAHISLPHGKKRQGMTHVKGRAAPCIGIYPIKGVHLLGNNRLHPVIGIVPVKGRSGKGHIKLEADHAKEQQQHNFSLRRVILKPGKSPEIQFIPLFSF